MLDHIYQFKEYCPLCGEKNCARFLGFYYRQVVDVDGRYYPNFPVPRFKCCGNKNPHKRRVQHTTFSLLHYHLLPYCKYSIPFIIRVLKARFQKQISLKVLQDHIADFSADAARDDQDHYIELSISRIYSFQKLILDTINKLWFNKYYYQLKIDRYNCTDSSGKEQINVFLEVSEKFECFKFASPIKGPCALSIDYYLEGGSYFKNSYFLFGTPSQFRV